MPAAAPDPPPPPPPDVPRHVADLSDVQRCEDSKKDDLMDRTDASTRSWSRSRRERSADQSNPLPTTCFGCDEMRVGG